MPATFLSFCHDMGVKDGLRREKWSEMTVTAEGYSFRFVVIAYDPAWWSREGSVHALKAMAREKLSLA